MRFAAAYPAGIAKPDAAAVRERVEQVEEDQRDLLAAWRAGGAVLRVVKWASAVGAGITAIWAFISTRT